MAIHLCYPDQKQGIVGWQKGILVVEVRRSDAELENCEN